MNSRQNEVIKELKFYSEYLGHSPGRREVPFSLYKNCISNFDSFNQAKAYANLSISKRTCDVLLENMFNKDINLVRLVSFLTFDGHLNKDLKGFLLASKDKNILIHFSEIIKNKFGAVGKYNVSNGYGYCNTYRVCNTSISKFLYSIGTPKGDKMVTEFDIPDWIKNNREFARWYLNIAFYCEGSMTKKSKNTKVIQFNLNKSEELINDGLNFIESIKYLLLDFDIETSNIWISKGNLRNRDGKTTKMLRFYVKSWAINNFIKEINWTKNTN